MRHYLIFFILLFVSTTATAQYSQHESIGYASTAYSLKKGENRFTSTYLMLNNYTRGITDNLSFSIGGLIPEDASARIKYTHKISKYLRLGISPVFGVEIDGQYSEFYTDLIGIATIGSPKYFINFSYARNFSPNSARSPNNLAFGFSVKLSDHFRLTSEHHIFYDDSRLPELAANSLMVRWSFKKRHQVQVGAYLLKECSTYYPEGQPNGPFCEFIEPFPIPTLSYSIYWGKD